VKIPDIRAYRPVAPETAAQLRGYEQASSLFPDATIQHRPLLGATIIQKSHANPKSTMINREKSTPLAYVLRPFPEASMKDITLEVSRVTFIGRKMSRKSLALMLNDPDNILLNEHKEYMRRMGKTISPDYQPHVSLLSMDVFFTSSTTLEWAESIAPTTVHLGKLAVTPTIEEIATMFLYKTGTIPGRLIEIPKKAPPSTTEEPTLTEATDESLSTTPIRDIKNPPPIPAGFLQSLQRSQNS